MDGVEAVARAVLYTLLLVGPGAGLCFIIFGRAAKGWDAALFSFALSPLVIIVEFLLLRLVGFAPAHTPIWIAALAIPGCLLWRRRLAEFSPPPTKDFALFALCAAAPVLFFFRYVNDESVRVLVAHNWLHSSIVYQFIDGSLRPEELGYAGLRDAYPWAAHIYSAVLALALDLSPSSSFVYANGAWLIALFFAASRIAALSGAGRLAVLTSPLWISFAVAAVGQSLKYLLKPVMEVSVFGDRRYEPFLKKFYAFDQMPFAIGLYSIVIMLCLDTDLPSRTRALALGLVLTLLFVIYPIFMPVGVGVVFARLVSQHFARPASPWRLRRQEALELAAAVAVALAVFFSYVAFVTEDRITSAGLHFDPSQYALKRLSQVSAALALPVLAYFACVRCKWKTRSYETIFIGLCIAGPAALAVMIAIPNWHNEYKYVFAAAIPGSPLIGVALETLLARSGVVLRAGLFVIAATGVVLPPALALRQPWPPWRGETVSVRVSGLDLRLTPLEPLAGAIEAIRTRTPAETITVSATPHFYMPTLTRRAQYAPYDGERKLKGIALRSDYVLFALKGYPRREIKARRAAMQSLLHGSAPEKALALAKIRELGRPVAVIIEKQGVGEPGGWAELNGERIYDGPQFAVILFNT